MEDRFVFCHITDTHFTHKSPRSRKDDFFHSLLAKMEEVVDLCNTKGVNVLLHTGDWFNEKSPYNVPHRVVSDIIKVLVELKCPVYSIAGNHDMVGGNLSSVERHPVRTLCEAGVITKLLGLGEEVRFHPFGAGFRDVCITGSPFSYTIDKPPRMEYIRNASDSFHIHMVHSILIPSGSYFADFSTFDDVVSLGSWDVLLCGHYHDGFGIEERTDKFGKKRLFSNPGALSRGVLKHADIDRDVMVNVGKVWVDRPDPMIYVKMASYVLKSALPSSEIFNIEEKKEATRISDELKRLSEDVGAQAAMLSESNDIDFLEEVKKNLNIDDGVKNKLFFYLERAGN